MPPSIIPFNKPHLTGKEAHYMYDAVYHGQLAGNGKYTKLCHKYFESIYGLQKCLLTTSCTDALEMAALLLDIKDGDEVIMPSFTFVSTANAFVLRGAKIVFVDSKSDHPGIDETSIEDLITKAIVVVHYAGDACNMDIIMDIAKRHKLFVVEDAAQAIDNYYTNSEGHQVPLGSIGHISTYSFHETKNIISGEGGMLSLNKENFINRAEIIWEKGTNRSAFFRGEVNKYGWVDIGSSFLPSEIIAAFLYAQLEALKQIQARRLVLWNKYHSTLKYWASSNNIIRPNTPAYSTNNAHMYYLVFSKAGHRAKLIKHLKENKILSVFHYQSLHKSSFYHHLHDGRELPNSDRYSECLLRLPLFFDLTDSEQDRILDTILSVELDG